MEPAATNPRRKLLRGSLAAPLVLTVASPSALAATSFQACIARVADQPQPTNAFVDVGTTPDGWYRTEVSIYSGKLKSTGMPGQYYENGGSYFPVDSCYPAGYVASDFTGPSGPTYVKKQLGLVYVNTSGSVVGFGPCKPSDGYAVSTSCWTSFQNG
jgi:hypothetical protein